MTKHEIAAQLRDVVSKLRMSAHGDEELADHLEKLAGEVIAFDSAILSREDQFKDSYVAAFMAAYKVSTYTKDCMHGDFDELRNHGVVEDAEHLAVFAWNAMVDLSKRLKATESPDA